MLRPERSNPAELIAAARRATEHAYAPDIDVRSAAVVRTETGPMSRA